MPFIFVGATFLFSLFTLFMPGTLAPVLLKKKAAKLRKETGEGVKPHGLLRTLEGD